MLALKIAEFRETALSIVGTPDQESNAMDTEIEDQDNGTVGGTDHLTLEMTENPYENFLNNLDNLDPRDALREAQNLMSDGLYDFSTYSRLEEKVRELMAELYEQNLENDEMTLTSAGPFMSATLNISPLAGPSPEPSLRLTSDPDEPKVNPLPAPSPFGTAA